MIISIRLILSVASKYNEQMYNYPRHIEGTDANLYSSIEILGENEVY